MHVRGLTRVRILVRLHPRDPTWQMHGWRRPASMAASRRSCSFLRIRMKEATYECMVQDKCQPLARAAPVPVFVGLEHDLHRHGRTHPAGRVHLMSILVFSTEGTVRVASRQIQKVEYVWQKK